MSSQKTTPDAYHPDSHPPSKPQTPKESPEKEVESKSPDPDEDDSISDDKSSHTSSSLGLAGDAEEKEPSPPAPPDPCTCHCGGCCCHGNSLEPRHCVRCHVNYTFNHPEACTVPHVFDNEGAEYIFPVDAISPSFCCGNHVHGAQCAKGDELWDQPSPCFTGWHTTDVRGVEDQYNGVNILRCITGPEGKCRRTRMKYPLHYELLYDDGVKYGRKDRKDHLKYLKRKREQMGDSKFESTFVYYEDDEVPDLYKRYKR